MKTAEFRVGNLLLKNNEVVTVMNIFGPSGLVQFKEEPFQRIPLLVADIQGIKLTEEWLINFGYTLITTSPSFKVFQGPRYSIYLYNDGNIIMNMGDSLKYVHNFQNRIYSLTGEELEVKGEG